MAASMVVIVPASRTGRVHPDAEALAAASTKDELLAEARNAGVDGASSMNKDELAEARLLLVATGSRDFVERLAETHLAQARTLVEELAVDLLPVVDACFLQPERAEEAVA